MSLRTLARNRIFTPVNNILTSTGWRQIVNADVAAGAAVAYSKLNLATSIVNADIAAGAAIVYSKLSLGGNVATADLAANAVTQIAQADGSTSSPTTTSTSYSDLAEMSVTLTTTGGPLLCLFDLSAFVSGSGLNATFAFALDGAAEVHARDFNLGISNATPVAMFHRFTSVSAGSHTVKVRWKTSGGTLTAFFVERSLIVEELKR